MNKILVIQTASIGDVILVTPVLEELHARFPAAMISVLVKKGNDALFTSHPFLHHVYVWDKSRGKYQGLIHLLLRIRKERFDLVINAQRFFSSGLLTAFSKGRYKAGFSKNPLAILFNKRVRHTIGDGSIHEAERNLLLIPEMDNPHGKAHIRLYPGIDDYDVVKSYKSAEYICISPASLWFTKQYPREKWIDFLNQLPEGLRVFLLGGEQDAALNESIIKESKHTKITNLAGNLSLLQSAALMEDARMNFVNDSAPLHLCSSRNAPVTAIFCSTVPAFGFGPYGSNGHVVEILENLNCRPCGLHGFHACPEKHFKCAHNIRTEQLLQHLG